MLKFDAGDLRTIEYAIHKLADGDRSAILCNYPAAFSNDFRAIRDLADIGEKISLIIFEDQQEAK